MAHENSRDLHPGRYVPRQSRMGCPVPSRSVAATGLAEECCPHRMTFSYETLLDEKLRSRILFSSGNMLIPCTNRAVKWAPIASGASSLKSVLCCPLHDLFPSWVCLRGKQLHAKDITSYLTTGYYGKVQCLWGIRRGPAMWHGRKARAWGGGEFVPKSYLVRTLGCLAT